MRGRSTKPRLRESSVLIHHDQFRVLEWRETKCNIFRSTHDGQTQAGHESALPGACLWPIWTGMWVLVGNALNGLLSACASSLNLSQHLHRLWPSHRTSARFAGPAAGSITTAARLLTGTGRQLGLWRRTSSTSTVNQDHAEHTMYNILALRVAKKLGLPKHRPAPLAIAPQISHT